MEVWGISSDVGDVDSIPWYKPARIKIWAWICCPLGNCPNYWTICYFWWPFPHSFIPTSNLECAPGEKVLFITLIIFTSLPKPVNCSGNWNLKRSCMVLMWGCHLCIYAYMISNASKGRFIKVVFKPVRRN